MRTPRTTRRAFSLLEMVLSLALAMVLLLALYLTLNTYITSGDVGRDTLQEGELARSILTRIADDVAGHVSSTDTRGLPDYLAAAQSGGNTTAYNVGVEWEVTSLITRDQRRRAAAAQAASVDLDLAWKEWQTAQEARTAAYAVLALRASLDVARQTEKRLGDNLDIVRRAVCRLFHQDCGYVAAILPGCHDCFASVLHIIAQLNNVFAHSVCRLLEPIGPIGSGEN